MVIKRQGDASEPLVRTEGLGKAYASLQALQEVNLEVWPGQVVALVGPNGAGKSTLLKLLMGLVLPTAGRAWIAGHPAGSVDAKARIGYLPQRVGFFEGLAVGEALHFFAGLRPALAGRPEAASRGVTEVLARVGLAAEIAQRPIRELSGGMLQRVALAQALLGQPPVLLLDEPTLNLDVEGRARLREVLREVRGSGRCALVSTHLLDEALGAADRVMILRDGRVLADEQVEAVRRRVRSRLFVQVEPPAEASRVLAARGFGVRAQNGGTLAVTCEPDEGVTVLQVLREAGLAPTAFHTARTSLEELVHGLLHEEGIQAAADGEGPVAAVVGGEPDGRAGR